MTPLPDAGAREAIRRDHDATLIVEAAAGTGKTTAVVSRVVEMIAAGRVEIEQIAAITFTERAGGELRLRIREGLEARIVEIERSGAGTNGAEIAATRERLEAALLHLDDAAIGTIHAFCGTILRERPVEAGVDPSFEILGGQEQQAFFERVFSRFVARQLENPGPGVARLLRRSHDFRQSPIDLLRNAGLQLLEYRGLDAPWKRTPWDREAAVRELVGDDEGAEGGETRPPTLFEIERLYRRIPRTPPGQKTNWLVGSVAAAAELAHEIRVRRSAGREELDWIEQALATLRVRAYRGAIPPKAPFFRARRDAFRKHLEEFQRNANADLAALLREDLRELVAGYHDAKQKAGKLDFEDLLDRTRDLLRRESGVRAELADRFRHIVVDEYQDTDPVQTEILLLLCAPEPRSGDWNEAVPAPGRLCLVADPKQSIYRFRRADVRHYEEVVARLVARGARRVVLTTNFRSVPAICQFVNEVMEPVFSKGGSPGEEGAPAAQVAYSPLSGFREAMPGPPLAPIPIPPGTVRELETREPGAVADFVNRLLASGFPVSGTDGRRRPVEPRDICLLFRRFRRFGRVFVPGPYAEALRSLDIPHSLQAVESYIGSAEVSFLRAALTAIEFPGDELSVYATLRGPLFSIRDQDLFLFRERRPGTRLRPSPSPPDPEGDPVASEISEALRFLFRLHERRNHQPFAMTIQQLLAEKRTETGFLFWKSPQQVLANLRRLTESARNFEARGGLSFRGFVELLAAQAESADAGTGYALDEEVGGVRIMTIHAAKGLEFPVVVLCDAAMGRNVRATRIVRVADGLHACDLGGDIRPRDLIEAEEDEKAEDRAELDRVLYVGLTRARDLLAAPVAEVKFRTERGLLDPVSAALSRVPELPGASRPLPRRPAVWSILSGGESAEAGEDEAGAFARERERVLAEARTPARRVATASGSALPDFGDAAVRTVTLPRDAGRPPGPEFGSLVHRVLECAALDSGEAAVQREALRAARELAVPEVLAKPATTAVVAALAHPLTQAARRAEVRGECFRELPLLHLEDAPAGTEDPVGFETGSALVPEEGEVDAPETAPGGSGPILVEGVADLVFRESVEEPWVVVDFKTDDRKSGDPERREATEAHYARQVRLYARAVERATGTSAVPVLFFL